MSRTTTFQTLLDRASGPVQTHILLAQLAILRKQDKVRFGERGHAPHEAILAVALFGFALVMLMTYLIRVGVTETRLVVAVLNALS